MDQIHSNSNNKSFLDSCIFGAKIFYKDHALMRWIISFMHRLHVEAILDSDRYTYSERGEINEQLCGVIVNRGVVLCPSRLVLVGDEAIAACQEIYIVELEVDGGYRGSMGMVVDLSMCEIAIHLFFMYDSKPREQRHCGFGFGVNESSSGEDNPVMYLSWELPNRWIHGVWETLLYEEDIKTKLLNHLNIMAIFSSKRIDPNIISLNR
jgi:hypothetical protein